MVKTRSDVDPFDPDICFTVVQHFGNYGRVYPDTFHIVYAYASLDVPYGVTGWHWHNNFEEAMLEARAWVSMPAITADICSLCRYAYPGPGAPRWNIYRGGVLAPIPPTFLWNYWDGPPPWPPVP